MIGTQDIVLSNFFKNLIVLGEEFLPLDGSVVLAPTHRSRWDALMIPMAAGRRKTKRDCRFMVTISEMSGIQGWFLSRLGCFPVDQLKPSMSSLRYSVDLLMDNQQLVLFPEGRINRNGQRTKIEPGIARLSQLAASKGVDVQVVPIGIAYSAPLPKLFGSAAICFRRPINIGDKGKQAVSEFNSKLAKSMHAAEQAALRAVGRID